MSENVEDSKGYYCLHRSFVETDTVPVGMSYVKAGGDEGMSLREAIQETKSNIIFVVVDKEGEVVFDALNIN